MTRSERAGPRRKKNPDQSLGTGTENGPVTAAGQGPGPAVIDGPAAGTGGTGKHLSLMASKPINIRWILTGSQNLTHNEKHLITDNCPWGQLNLF